MWPCGGESRVKMVKGCPLVDLRFKIFGVGYTPED